MKFVISISILLTLLCSTSAVIPFDPAYRGSTHEVVTANCEFDRASSTSVAIKGDKLTYTPQINNDPRGCFMCVNCEGYTDLYYRQRPKHMRLEVLPVAFASADQNGNVPSCSGLQKKQIYWPWGPTRPGYVREFTKMFNATLEMKKVSGACVKKTGQIDAVIGFMYTVAYDYSIKLPTATQA